MGTGRGPQGECGWEARDAGPLATEGQEESRVILGCWLCQWEHGMWDEVEVSGEAAGVTPGFHLAPARPEGLGRPQGRKPQGGLGGNGGEATEETAPESKQVKRQAQDGGEGRRQLGLKFRKRRWERKIGEGLRRWAKPGGAGEPGVTMQRGSRVHTWAGVQRTRALTCVSTQTRLSRLQARKQ